MLVLTRKVFEQILIDEGKDSPIVIKILTVGREKVRLGIEAPAHMKIQREELVRPDCHARRKRRWRNRKVESKVFTFGNE